MACKLMSQTRDLFPLDVALHLSRSLGYDASAMAELLPVVATGVVCAVNDTKDQHGKS